MELGNIKASQEKVARRRVGRGIGSGTGYIELSNGYFSVDSSMN